MSRGPLPRAGGPGIVATGEWPVVGILDAALSMRRHRPLPDGHHP